MLALSVTDLVPRSTVNVALEPFLPSKPIFPYSLSVPEPSVPLPIVTRSFALSPITLIVPSVARPSLESFVSVVLAGLSPSGSGGVWVVIVTQSVVTIVVVDSPVGLSSLSNFTSVVAKPFGVVVVTLKVSPSLTVVVMPFSVIFVLLLPEPVSTEVRLTRFFANLMVKVSVPLDTTPMLPSDNLARIAFALSSAEAVSANPSFTSPTMDTFSLSLRLKVLFVPVAEDTSPWKNNGVSAKFFKSPALTTVFSLMASGAAVPSLLFLPTLLILSMKVFLPLVSFTSPPIPLFTLSTIVAPSSFGLTTLFFNLLWFNAIGWSSNGFLPVNGLPVLASTSLALYQEPPPCPSDTNVLPAISPAL